MEARTDNAQGKQRTKQPVYTIEISEGDETLVQRYRTEKAAAIAAEQWRAMGYTVVEVENV
jgi:hypothetical protein